MDVRRGLAPFRYFALQWVVDVGRAHENCRHAECVRFLEIVRDVLEHRSLAPSHPVPGDERGVGCSMRLWHIVARGDVPDILELVQDAELGRHPLGMLARAVGEYEPAA